MAATHASAIVLAGGKSTRLGRDKASEVVLGLSLLQRVTDRLDGLVVEVVIVKASGQALPDLRHRTALRVVEDLYPEIGPLGGIFTGLTSIEASHALAVACDMPLLQRPLVSRLFDLADDHDVVVPVTDGYPQTLCAVYGRRCLEPMREQIEGGRYKITGFFDAVDVLYLPPEEWQTFDPDGLSFQNLNREEDLRRAEDLLRSGR